MSAAMLAPSGVDRQVELARTASILSRLPGPSRNADFLVARALGWEWQPIGGNMCWRRWRTSWSKQGPIVPPRYTADLRVLLGEVPASMIVQLTITRPRSSAKLDEADAVPGDTIELALAGALVSGRLAEAVAGGGS